ncbi:hypothetical protein L204_104232 [Cryptococcus depauperatus]|nr:hypothetical protein L204_04944 [Cryptococcus depauperatus CBS 7855]
MRVQYTIFISLFLLLPPSTAETSRPNTGDQRQAFQFSFTDSNVILPVAYTCPTPLSVFKRSLTNTETDDPKGPYTMVTLVHEQLVDGAGVQYERVYSASLNVGDLSGERDIAHPWGTGTQFIPCMWAANGVSGGCQDLYTIVPSANLTAEAYANNTSACRRPGVLESWATPINETLDVRVAGASGEVAINAWPPSCSDLQFTPKNGTAPYTLLIAPANHPPVNITSTAAVPLNYTIRLTHGQAFMVAMYDSAGNSWAYGPLHAGLSDDLECLIVATGQEEAKKEGYSLGVLVGGIVGAFVFGAVGATVLLWLLGRKKLSSPKRTPSTEDLYANPQPASYRTSAGSVYMKPALATEVPFAAEFDTPATLYDPHISGPCVAYPQLSRPSETRHSPNSSASPASNARESPRMNNGRSFSGSLGARNNTGDYISPYEVGRPYSDHITMPEFRAAGMSGNEPSTQPDQLARTGSGQAAQGHDQNSNYSSQRSAQLPTNPTLAHGRFGIAAPTSPASCHSIMEEPGSPSSPVRAARNVYIVHSDGGGGDVTIQLPDVNSRVIELPPGYRRTPSPTAAISRESLPLSNHRVSMQRGHSAPSEVEMNGLMPRPDTNQLELTRSITSGLSVRTMDMGEEELRARAEAAMREKQRPL